MSTARRSLWTWVKSPHPNGPHDWDHWELVRGIARCLGADGCSGPASELYRAACLEHDVHYRTWQTVASVAAGNCNRGALAVPASGTFEPISRLRADWLMLCASMTRSPVRWFDPIAWVRFLVLRLLGWHAWRDNGERRHLLPGRIWPPEETSH